VVLVEQGEDSGQQRLQLVSVASAILNHSNSNSNSNHLQEDSDRTLLAHLVSGDRHSRMKGERVNSCITDLHHKVNKNQAPALDLDNNHPMHSANNHPMHLVSDSVSSGH
jgi:hypothetical protein